MNKGYLCSFKYCNIVWGYFPIANIYEAIVQEAETPDNLTGNLQMKLNLAFKTHIVHSVVEVSFFLPGKKH